MWNGEGLKRFIAVDGFLLLAVFVQMAALRHALKPKGTPFGIPYTGFVFMDSNGGKRHLLRLSFGPLWPATIIFSHRAHGGLWHDEIHLTQVQLMPIRLPTDAALRQRVVQIVEKLRAADVDFHQLPLAGPREYQHIPDLERELDDAVYDLYELSTAERDRVRELCTIDFGLLYENQRSKAVAKVDYPARHSGTFASVVSAEAGLGAYLRVFLETWRRELASDTDLHWHVLSPPSRAPLLAVSFSMNHEEDLLPADGAAEEWRNLLAKLQRLSRIPGGSPTVFFDTYFRHVGTRDVLFIKRNEQRFWTRSAAREDAQSTLTYLMNQEDGILSERV